MKEIQINFKGKTGSRDIDSEATYQAEGLLDISAALPAGIAATVLAKTDANTATVTLPEGHGQTNGNFDVHFGVASCRYGVPGTIAGNVLSLDGGAGDDFPVATTAVVIAKQVVITAPLTGSLLVATFAWCNKRCHLDFKSSAPASLLQLNLTARKAWPWANDFGTPNPLSGLVVATIAASCGVAEEADLAIPMLFDAVV
jgi:hypothetical protein